MKTTAPPASTSKPELGEIAEPIPCLSEAHSKHMKAPPLPQHAATGDFVANGLHSAKKAKAENRYVSAEAVLALLEQKLVAARLLR